MSELDESLKIKEKPFHNFNSPLQNLNRADNFLCDMVNNDMITIFISSTHQKYNISNCLYFFGGKLQTKGRI